MLSSRIFAVFPALLLAACGSLGTRTEEPHQTGRFQRAEITESSGVAASRKQPGVYWTINDSGGEPVVYALDETGRDLGSFNVPGARNVDWESLTLGPCVLPPWRDCLYIGDTGDNARRRRGVMVYHFPEPSVTGSQPDSGVNYHLPITYTDVPHDVEAMYLMPDGALGLVTKGRSGEAAIYRVHPDDWGSGIGSARRTMVLFPDIPRPQDRVTGAALSSKGSSLAILTYTDIYIFKTDPRTGLPSTNIPDRVCSLDGLGLRQSEAVAWVGGSNNRLLVTSEGQHGDVALVTCGG